MTRALGIVGQDDILRAGWQPELDALFIRDSRRVTNPPQVSNLPHSSRRIPVFAMSLNIPYEALALKNRMGAIK